MKPWQTTTLDEMTAQIKTFWRPGDGQCKYIGLEHINEGSLTINGVGNSTNLESNKHRFLNNDILFGKLRPYFRKVIRAPFDGICSTDIWVFRAKEGYDQNYIFYFFANPIFIDKATKASIGTKMPRADWDYLKNTKWLVPQVPEQTAIAGVLSSLDDKIELLRNQNKTLKKMAETIFKHWFIDFEFPNEKDQPHKSSGGKMVDSELGEIPEGWRAGKVKELGKVVCGKTPSKEKKEYFGGNTPFIKIPDMHNRMFIINTDDSLSSEGANSQKNKFIPKNSICVSCIATVGLVSLTTKGSQTNQQINSLVPKKENWIEYIYFTFKRMGHFLNTVGSGGTATLNINTGIFSNLDVILPDEEIIKEYHTLTKSLFDKLLQNNYQIQTLSRLRDTLLPKFMSGEVRVKI